MPAKLERRLAAGARRAGIRRGTRHWRAYVYGTLGRLGMLHRRRRRRRS